MLRGSGALALACVGVLLVTGAFQTWRQVDSLAAFKDTDFGRLLLAKLVVFANAPSDNPFMAGAFHGAGEPDCVINIGVSGPGVVRGRPWVST